MTTLVALSTKDALVMGCDSLGSATRPMVDPFDLVDQFFDTRKGWDWSLKLDENKNPVLKNFDDIYNAAQIIPFDHMPNMTKLFPLSPLQMGVMMTGIASIGDRTIKNLIRQFRGKILEPLSHSSKNYTVESISKELMNFIGLYYEEEFKDIAGTHSLELMLGGYDKEGEIPSTYRIIFDPMETDEERKQRIEEQFEKKFGIAFGGQMQEIQ